MSQEEIIKAINEKYKSLGENPDTYLKGLLQAKPINYWDYIEVDSLLSLQKPLLILKMRPFLSCTTRLPNWY